MIFRFLTVLFILSLVSCMPKLGSNGRFKADVAIESYSHPELNLESYKTLISPLGYRNLFEKMNFFDNILVGKDFSDSVFVEINNSSRYENIKLDLERQGIGGPVLLAQHFYTSGLLPSQDLKLIDLETGEVILDVRIPILSSKHPFIIIKKSGLAHVNAVIEYISKNSSWDPSQNR